MTSSGGMAGPRSSGLRASGSPGAGPRGAAGDARGCGDPSYRATSVDALGDDAAADVTLTEKSKPWPQRPTRAGCLSWWPWASCTSTVNRAQSAGWPKYSTRPPGNGLRPSLPLGARRAVEVAQRRQPNGDDAQQQHRQATTPGTSHESGGVGQRAGQDQPQRTRGVGQRPMTPTTRPRRCCGARVCMT